MLPATLLLGTRTPCHLAWAKGLAHPFPCYPPGRLYQLIASAYRLAHPLATCYRLPWLAVFHPCIPRYPRFPAFGFPDSASCFPPTFFRFPLSRDVFRRPFRFRLPSSAVRLPGPRDYREVAPTL